jgi:iron complex transport system ATP-binding protein
MLLRAEHVSYAYRVRGSGSTSFELRDVSVGIAKGSLTALLGPNGGGKTTLVSLMAGLLRPQQGCMLLDGVDMSRLGPRQLARRVAVVPQETHPAFDYTVMEMVLMGRHPHLGAFALEGPEDIAIAERCLAATGTAVLADRHYMTLSGGEKQRVIIASGLAQSSDLLLLDEPTASLDLSYQLEMSSLLRQLNREQGVTMVLATHDLNLAAALCTHVVMIRDGSVVAQGATADVLTPARVRELYGVEAEVQFHDRAGHLTVVPIRRVAP